MYFSPNFFYIFRIIRDNPDGLNATNYTTNMSFMVHMEDLQVQQDMFAYDMDNIKFGNVNSNGFYQLEVKNLEEGRPSLLENDSLWILPMSKSPEKNQGRIDGIIYRIEKDNLLIEFVQKKDNKRKRIKIDVSLKYRVHFVANRVNIQMQQHALARISQQGLAKFFFPDKPNKLSASVDDEE